MAQSVFNVHGSSVMQVRLEPTAIIGTGSHVYPNLTLALQFQLLPAGHPPVSYTLVKLGGQVSIANETAPLTVFDAGTVCEESNVHPYERTVTINIPLNLMQIKHIEDLRSGSDPIFVVTLTGLVALREDGRFERLSNVSLPITVPRSHWIDKALNVWNISSLRLLEVALPSRSRTEIAEAQARLVRAEQLYRTGDYSHVLTQLRSAFAAIAACYSAQLADKNTFEKMLVNTHPKIREKLRDSFAYFCTFLNLGPHEPSPTPEVPTPISRHDARFALVAAHAIFEYFSSEGWSGI